MRETLPKYPRILAIAPSTRGFGFAVVEGLDMLVDWGVKSIRGDKNTQSISKVEELISHYEPHVIVLEDASIKPFRRSERIRALSKRIVGVAKRRNVIVALLSREQVKQAHFADGKGTKDALAGILANKFPEELGLRLPPKRRPWMSEDYRMGIFEAVALALVVRRTRP
jgi:Holliday junction resolvasome RuvABC endonuclease subunit